MRFLDVNPLALGEIGATLQPGLSSFQNGKWIHGQEAFSVCRIDPQSIRYNLWENLNLDPVHFPGRMRHAADLAMTQLQNLCSDLSRDVWTVLTPSHWKKEQLQVFLGIAAECRMDVRAMVPRCLIIDLPADADDWIGWEWHWQRLNRVQLKRDGEEWRLEACTHVPEGGVLDFFRRESRSVAKASLESHRLDPLYSGQSEQVLFEGWWKWHFHQKIWTFERGGEIMDFSGEAASLRKSHEPWALAQNLKMNDPQQFFPAGLRHCLTGEKGTGSMTDLKTFESRLGDLSEPGARWKDHLPMVEKKNASVLPVTHWVSKGIAEKAPQTENTIPGQTITLSDGREVLAVHVPENL